MSLGVVAVALILGIVVMALIEGGALSEEVKLDSAYTRLATPWRP